MRLIASGARIPLLFCMTVAAASATTASAFAPPHHSAALRRRQCQTTTTTSPRYSSCNTRSRSRRPPHHNMQSTTFVVADAAAAASGMDPSVVSGTIASIAIAAAVFYWNSPETSDDIRAFWDSKVVSQANEATITTEDVEAKIAMDIPVITKGVTSPEQLTVMMKDVADTVEKQGREQQDKKKTVAEKFFQRTPIRISRVYTEPTVVTESSDKQQLSSTSAAPAPNKDKPRFVTRLFKKIVMPWKKWESL